MRLLIMNPPHTAIGSRIPREHLPPLGLLCVGGPLIDAGHEVRLLDAEFGPLSIREIVLQAAAARPEAVLLGHSGSTSAHPTVGALTRALREAMPGVRIIYGGVFPTYHWREILSQEPQIDVIVRGEGDHTAVRVVRALERGESLGAIPGIAYCEGGVPVATADAEPIADLETTRVGWELIDPKRYSYWGDRRAVVVQFSRGCPHRCSYCGQQPFWKRWRHRDPQKFADEIAWLHREHGVEVFNFADENPTASREAWLAFLRALIAHKIDVTLVGSTRADDIVRDADVLHLYKQAGVARWLLGIENYDDAALARIAKGASTTTDRLAIQLLRKHGILSMATWVVGFAEERDRDYLRGLRQLLAYDPDQIQVVFATPHRWTRYFEEERQRRVIQMDQRMWDYKHQVLASRHVPAWRVMLWVKFIEMVVQMRPRALGRWLWHPDPGIRAGIRWYYRIGRKVWFHEIGRFFCGTRRTRNGPTLGEFWGVAEERTRGRIALPVAAVEGVEAPTL